MATKQDSIAITEVRGVIKEALHQCCVAKGYDYYSYSDEKFDSLCKKGITIENLSYPTQVQGTGAILSMNGISYKNETDMERTVKHTHSKKTKTSHSSKQVKRESVIDMTMKVVTKVLEGVVNGECKDTYEDTKDAKTTVDDEQCTGDSTVPPNCTFTEQQLTEELNITLSATLTAKAASVFKISPTRRKVGGAAAGIAAGAGAGAGGGAGIGAIIGGVAGSVIPVGGTIIGAWVGAGIGAAIGTATGVIGGAVGAPIGGVIGHTAFKVSILMKDIFENIPGEFSESDDGQMVHCTINNVLPSTVKAHWIKTICTPKKPT